MNNFFNLSRLAFLFLLILLTFLFYKIVAPFIIDILLTIIFVHIFEKPYRYLCKQKFLNEPASAILVVLLTLISIIIPFLLVGLIILQQSGEFVSLVEEGWLRLETQLFENGEFTFFDQFELYKEYEVEILEKLTETMNQSTSFFVGIIESTFVDGTFLLFHFMMILTQMYFVLIDGEKLENEIHRLIPIPDEDEDEIFKKVIKVADAVIWGTFVIGLIEGVFGGLLFWILGIKTPLFWGMIMCVFSMIPILGANGVIVPAALIMILFGNVWQGVVLFLVGFGGISLSQNFIKPNIVGSRMGMHEGIVLVSTVGGILWLGLVGFIIGPILASICIVTWQQLAKRYQEEYTIWNKGEGKRIKKIGGQEQTIHEE